MDDPTSSSDAAVPNNVAPEEDIAVKIENIGVQRSSAILAIENTELSVEPGVKLYQNTGFRRKDTAFRRNNTGASSRNLALSNAILADADTPSSSNRHTAMLDMPPEERPRERVWSVGADSLSNAELLAILLRMGTRKSSALGVATHILSRFDGIRGIQDASLEELSQIPGVGKAKAATIKAALELGVRVSSPKADVKLRFLSASAVYKHLSPTLLGEKREHLVAMLLDARGSLIRTRTIAIGDLTSCIMNAREVFREAVRHSAASIILAHNHPSGDPTPSAADIILTKRIAEAGAYLNIEVMDHVILGEGTFVSLRERQLL